MPRIYLTGEQIIDITREEALRIEQEWKNGNPYVEVGSSTVKNSRIVRVDVGRLEAEKSIAEFSTDELKSFLGDYEQQKQKFIANYKANHPEAQYPATKARNAWRVHCGVCDENGRIYYSALMDGRYEDFSRKEAALSELQYRREYAARKEYGALAERAELEAQFTPQYVD
jgi:hypothetical protein